MRTQTTLEKALDINTDPKLYGTFAEIGAGQEVARQFFQAGKASQTIALTISAYDMTYSDIIYGKEKSGRYVCDSRLKHMLEKEYEKLIKRLNDVRGSKTTFFAFADTVATASKNSHGWMGVKFQHKVGAEASEVRLHVRLLDRQRLLQQENLSKLGVNLIHSCFYKTADSVDFTQSIFDQLKRGSIAVDAIHFEGPAFAKFDPLYVNISLIQLGWSDAIFINTNGSVENTGDALWDKNIFIQRASYKPVTMTHLDIASRGVKHFENEFKLKPSEVTTIFEFTLDNRLKNEKVSVEDAIQKVKMILALNLPVLITSFPLFYEMKEFIRLASNKPLAIVIGATHLDKLFDENFYSDLGGGLMEGMGKLLDKLTRLYIYPHKTKDICLLTKSYFPKPAIKHIYAHFIENKFIQDIAGCDEIQEFMHSKDIIKMIKAKKTDWKKYVPTAIHSIVLKMN
jgi:hypothetical protein